MILVTGGFGFVGSHTVRALLERGEKCLVAGRTGGPSPAPGAVRAEVDCRDLDRLLALGREHDVTGIVHLAAAAIGGDPFEELHADTVSLLNVLTAARTWGVGRTVLAGSIGVYAGAAGPVLREDAPLPVASPHAIAAAKKSAEILALAADATAVSARIGAVWGPGGRARSPFFALPQLVHAAVNGTPLGETPYADAAIDLIYAPDCGRALALLATAPGLKHRTYNVAGGRAVGNREVVETLGRVLPAYAPPVLADGTGPHDPVHLDTARLRADTGYEAAYDLDAGLAAYAAWIRATRRP